MATIETELQSAYIHIRDNPGETESEFVECSGVMMDFNTFDELGNRCGLFWRIAGNNNATIVEICNGARDSGNNVQIYASKPKEDAMKDASWIVEMCCDWIKESIDTSVKFAMRSGQGPQLQVAMGGRTVELYEEEDDTDDWDDEDDSITPGRKLEI